MKENILKKRLKEGQKVFGTWSMLPSAGVINVISETGFGFCDSGYGTRSFFKKLAKV